MYTNGITESRFESLIVYICIYCAYKCQLKLGSEKPRLGFQSITIGTIIIADNFTISIHNNVALFKGYATNKTNPSNRTVPLNSFIILARETHKVLIKSV